MTLLDKSQYILGYSDKRIGFKEPLRTTQEVFDKYVNILEKSVTAPDVLKAVETPRDFFRIEELLKPFVRAEERDEFFYSLKNGFAFEDVPSKAIYYLLKAYDVCKTPNMIFKLIPEAMLTVMFTNGYLRNITWRDVVCTLFSDLYIPFDSSRRKVNYGKYSEIYIEDTDMCAVVPDIVASVLSDEDLRNIKVKDGGIMLENKYLSMMFNMTGACATYDMRELI